VSSFPSVQSGYTLYLHKIQSKLFTCTSCLLFVRGSYRFVNDAGHILQAAKGLISFQVQFPSLRLLVPAAIRGDRLVLGGCAPSQSSRLARQDTRGHGGVKRGSPIRACARLPLPSDTMSGGVYGGGKYDRAP